MKFREFLEYQIQKGKIEWDSRSQLIRQSGSKANGNTNKILKEYEHKFKFGSITEIKDKAIKNYFRLQPKNSLIITSYNIHKGMSPLNRFVKMEGIAAALNQVQSDIICLQEVQGQNLKRVVKYNEFPDQSQHEWFGEYLQLENSYGKNVE